MIPLLDDFTLDLDTLKFKALLMTQNSKAPNEITAKITELILNEELSRTEFILNFNTITQPYQYKNWKFASFLNNFKDRFSEVIVVIPWRKISIVVVSGVLIFYVVKKIKIKKRTKKRLKKTFGVLFNIFERFGALCAYIVPLISIYTAYIPGLVSSYPYLQFFVPDIMQDAMDAYVKHPWRINYGYFFTTMYAVTLFKFPKPRFIRFHLVRGLMLLAFQGIPDALFQMLQSADTLTQQQVVTTTLCVFAINLSWLLPCIYQAITYTYPKSSFIREAIEINIGRDKDEGFKWWDRR